MKLQNYMAKKVSTLELIQDKIFWFLIPKINETDFPTKKVKLETPEP